MAQQTYLLLVLMVLGLSSTIAQEKQPPRPLKIIKPAKKEVWKIGQVTTYAQKFQGRRMSSGRRFSHSEHYVACREGQFGRRIELRYGKNGRSVCIIGDRGRLPYHRPDCWQFDLPRQAARELGLYRVVHGKTDRYVRWRYIND